MRRREFSTLHPTTISPDQPILISLWRQALGYVEGETVLLRSAEGDLTRLPALVGELLGLDVGVLIMVGAPTVKAARQATATAPIVAIDLETNPVLPGYAGSVARPGGNVTGLFMDMSSLAGGVVAVP
jgi:putative tryptophan/tyrosine transport system substrate-binding protein